MNRCSFSMLRIRAVLAAAALALSLYAAAGHAESRQMYAIAGGSFKINGTFYGDYSVQYPVVMYRVEDGTLVKYRTLATQFQGSVFVRPYNDLGVVLVGSQRISQGTLLLDVTDLSNPPRRKSHDIDPSCGECTMVNGHLVKRGDRLIYMAREYSGDMPPRHHYEGAYYSFREPNPGLSIMYGDKVRYHGIDIATGEAVGDLSQEDIPRIHSFDGNNTVLHRVPVRTPFETSGAAAPPEDPVLVQRLVDEADKLHDEDDWYKPNAYEVVNTDYMRVVTRPKGRGVTFSVLHVQDKADGEWTGITWEGDRLSPRGFGAWLVAEQAGFEIRGEDRYDESEPIYRHDYEGSGPETHFLSPKAYFLRTHVKQTGRLYFYNVRSGERVVHDTGEENSAILLVDQDDVAYFRVHDTLYRADLADGRLDNIEPVAKSPMLPYVYWLVTSSG